MIVKIIGNGDETKTIYLDDIERVDVTHPKDFVLSYRNIAREDENGASNEIVIGCYEKKVSLTKNEDEKIIINTSSVLCVDELIADQDWIIRQLTTAHDANNDDKAYYSIKCLKVRYRKEKSRDIGYDQFIAMPDFTTVYLLNDNGKTIERLN